MKQWRYSLIRVWIAAAGDLDLDPLASWDGTGHLAWEQTVSLEEVERNTIGVSSTSPGTDRVTVRLLKACWGHIKHVVHGLFSRCLALNYFPQSWKLAEDTRRPFATIESCKEFINKPP